MVGKAVMLQPPVILTLQANWVQSSGAKNAAEEVVQKETVTKDVVGDADASTA